MSAKTANPEGARGDLHKLQKTISRARMYAQLVRAASAASGDIRIVGIDMLVCKMDAEEFITPHLVEAIDEADEILGDVLEKLGLERLFIDPEPEPA